eukprot:9495294-Pyramimonas_sp.AAC.1
MAAGFLKGDCLRGVWASLHSRFPVQLPGLPGQLPMRPEVDREHPLALLSTSPSPTRNGAPA